MHIHDIASLLEEIVSALKLIEAEEGGRELADLLRYKYWSDSAATCFISMPSKWKQQFEIRQRFYQGEGKPVTLDEAYRFLELRWMEKRVQQTSRRPVPIAAPVKRPRRRKIVSDAA